VVLCGHGTLSAAKVVFGLSPSFNTVTFQTRYAGLLTAVKKSSAEELLPKSLDIQITLPIMPVSEVSAEYDQRARELFVKHSSVEESDIVNVVSFPWGPGCALIEIKDTVDLKNLTVSAKSLVSADPKAKNREST
jgi:predicted PhzF superfamily epimerase YddE/YHI9